MERAKHMEITNCVAFLFVKGGCKSDGFANPEPSARVVCRSYGVTVVSSPNQPNQNVEVT